MKKYYMLPLLWAIVLLPGQAQVRSEKTREVLVENTGPETVGMVISMVAGELRVSGQASGILEGRVLFSRPEWEPLLSTRMKGTQMQVGLKMPPQGDNYSLQDRDKNHWDLKVNPDLPLDLVLRMGAGDGDFLLNGLALRRLYLKLGAGDFTLDVSDTPLEKMLVKAGVGKMSIDLGGERTNDLIAELNCGIGELTLYLPDDYPVFVYTTGILGQVNAVNFVKTDRSYVNRAFGQEGPEIKVIINGGVGQVNLVTR